MGAIAQQRRVSKTRKLKRRTHYKISAPGMVKCPTCGEMKLGHRVCPVCGFYNEKKVVEVEVKETEKVEESTTPKKGRKAKKEEK